MTHETNVPEAKVPEGNVPEGNPMSEDKVTSGGTKQMQVKELVDHIEQFHVSASRLYGDEQRRAQTEEVGLLLSHLAHHERAVARKLSEYRDHAAPEVLETWIKYVPKISVRSLLDRLDSLSKKSPDEIAEVASVLSNTIIAIYDAVAEATAAEKAREAVSNLRLAEVEDKIYATRSADRR